LAVITVALTALVGLSPVAAEASVAVRPVWAHRGGTGNGYVENTRANYRAAMRQGSLRWETDVRFTGTGQAVLLHDSHLGKFRCPDVRIIRVSVPRARKCRAPNGQSITTLSEFAQDVQAYRARAWVELKTRPTRSQWRNLQASIKPIRTRIVVQSFLPPAVVAATARGYTTALLTSNALRPRDLPSGTDWYAPQYKHVTGAQATAMHRAGFMVAAWTPSKDRWRSVPASVDQLISNDIP
jgi:glycerophosphoryl diester phosphodiesterase